MLVSFCLYSARDFVLLFVTKMTCLPDALISAQAAEAFVKLGSEQLYLGFSGAPGSQRSLRKYVRQTIRRLPFLHGKREVVLTVVDVCMQCTRNLEYVRGLHTIAVEKEDLINILVLKDGMKIQ